MIGRVEVTVKATIGYSVFLLQVRFQRGRWQGCAGGGAAVGGGPPEGFPWVCLQ